MPPVELARVSNIPDLILKDHFSLIIPNVPGGGDGEVLEVMNVTAQLPGKRNATYSANLHRHKITRAARQEFDGSFTATFVDTTDKKVMDAFKNWQQQITDQATGLPRPSARYITTAVARIYGPDNNVIEARKFFNLFPTNVAAIDLGSDAGPATISVSFSYDHWQPGDF